MCVLGVGEHGCPRPAAVGSWWRATLDRPCPFPLQTEYISTRWYRAPECLLTDGYYGPEMVRSAALAHLSAVTSCHLLPTHTPAGHLGRGMRHF